MGDRQTYSVYVIWSGKLGKLYVGSSSNLTERVTQHNKGMSRFTSRGMPWVLRYCEDYATRELARRRELFLKSGAGRIFLKRVLSGASGYPEVELSSDCLKFERFG
jgi:putative endonuclease